MYSRDSHSPSPKTLWNERMSCRSLKSTAHIEKKSLWLRIWTASKKLLKDEDRTVNAIEKKKRSDQMRSPNRGQEKKHETDKSKDKCGRGGYDKPHKKCPAMGQQCGLRKKMNLYIKRSPQSWGSNQHVAWMNRLFALVIWNHSSFRGAVKWNNLVLLNA